MVRDSVATWLLTVASLVSGLIITPVILSSTGESGYGLWRILLLVIGYYGIFEVVVRSVVVRFLAIALAQEKLDDVRGLLNSARL